VPARCWTAVCDLFTGVPADPEPPRPPPAPIDPQTDVGFATRLSTQLLRRPARLVTACLATVLGPAVVAQAGSLTAQPVPPPPSAEGASPAGAVLTPVPGDPATWVPVARQAAATCPGLPSSVLVAISHLESSLGLQPWVSSAGAVGPMQFLPSTWAAYGADGDGDGRHDVMNPIDAVHGAARLLCANGGADPAHLSSALWNYNHSDDYVRQVIGLARFISVDS
jgi:hypothetical protein